MERNGQTRKYGALFLKEDKGYSVLQTVAKNYKKYNFFLDFFNRIWYNIFEDKGKCNESFRLKSRTISFKQDIAKQKIKLIWKVASNCTNLLHELVEVFSMPCLKIRTF